MIAHRTVVVSRPMTRWLSSIRVLEALPPESRVHYRAIWREQVRADGTCLAEALESMLDGPLDAQPILLIVDDLERVLEPPATEGVRRYTR